MIEPAAKRPARVLQVTSRLNIGGVAIQAICTTRMLRDRGYEVTLVRGKEDPDEGSMDYLAEDLGVRPVCVRWLRRNVGWRDLPAFAALCWIIARQHPDIVHTHAAKAGTLGRVASSVAPGRARRVLVHTYHGHSLSGYFSPVAERLFLIIERFLARRTSRLVAVSEQVRDDLVRLRVAEPDDFEIIRCGFDLSPFLVTEPERARRREETRASLRVATDASVVTLIARLVPIKRVDRFLRVASMLAGHGETRFVVVGDGELRTALQGSTTAQVLGDRLIWTGFRRDIADICFASDVVALTSDNEGTPISLIESLASGTPVVSTDVGGVGAVVVDGITGLLAPPDAEGQLAEAIERLLDDGVLARRLAEEGQQHVRRSFGLERLLDDLDSLYARLLEEQRSAAPMPSASASVRD